MSNEKQVRVVDDDAMPQHEHDAEHERSAVDAPATEMEIDLGYAESNDDYNPHAEQDNDEQFEPIHTLSLDQMVIEEDDDTALAEAPLAGAGDVPAVTDTTEPATGAPDYVAVSALLNSETSTRAATAPDQILPEGPASDPAITEQSIAEHAADDAPLVTLQEVVPDEVVPDNDLTGTLDAATFAEPPQAQQAPLAPPSEATDALSETMTFAPVKDADATVAPSPFSKPLPEKSSNPFLPQHILDKLNKGRKDLADDIAQSSAALDVSTALLRTHARAERISRPQQHNTNPFASKDTREKQKQQLVDDLVDEYVPLIAAELRRRLHKLLDE